jgi:hypothetical protein
MPLRFHAAILVPDRLPDDLLLELREGEEELGAMVDAGSASAHRGWTPTTDDLDALMSNPEHFVERAFIAPDTKSGPMRCNARSSLQAWSKVPDATCPFAPSFKKPDSPLDCFPCRMPPCHVPGVEPRVPQRRSRLASDVEAVDTKRDDGLGL